MFMLLKYRSFKDCFSPTFRSYQKLYLLITIYQLDLSYPKKISVTLLIFALVRAVLITYKNSEQHNRKRPVLLHDFISYIAHLHPS